MVLVVVDVNNAVVNHVRGVDGVEGTSLVGREMSGGNATWWAPASDEKSSAAIDPRLLQNHSHT